jgi:hypothetical protein
LVQQVDRHHAVAAFVEAGLNQLPARDAVMAALQRRAGEVQITVDLVFGRADAEFVNWGGERLHLFSIKAQETAH